jgi:hypothetical protein
MRVRVKLILARTFLPLFKLPCRGLSQKHILICLSDTVILRDLFARAFGGVSRNLNDHPQDLVPRSLSNLRDEDLQFLNALSRRLLERVD